MPSPDSTISPAQQRIIRAIAQFTRKEQPAFVPQLVQELGLAFASSLNPTLKILQRDGLIEVAGGGAKGRSRVVRLTPQGRQAAGLGGLPLIGRIAAGRLTEALAEPEQMLEDRELLPYQPGDFLLRVHGDSMTGDGILDGDKVLLRPEVDCREGEIAAVLVGSDHEATLKRVFREGSKIRLKPGNPLFPEVTVDAAEVKIAGVFRGLIRDQRR
ncbi:MAG TPA: transcriptional repressor LexA [Chthoniobacterales bacterium]|jgi:repressor LexA